MRDVGLDGVLADDELGGDLGVRAAAREQAQHLDLAGRERRRAQAAAPTARPRLAKRSISRRVTAGAKSEPPSATTRIAARSCASGASLSRKPLAPARSAAKTYSSRSKVVRTSTRGGSGIARDLPRRLDPVDARHPHVHQHDVGPQLAGRGRPPRRRRLPRQRPRARGRRRGSSGSPSGRAAGRRRGGRGSQRQPSVDREAAVRPRPALELAAEDSDALAHADEAVSAAAPLAAPAPVSAISSSSASGRKRTEHAGPRRPGVLERVRQRLLHDPVRRDIDARRQLAPLAFDAQLDGEASVAHLARGAARGGRGTAAARARRPRPRPGACAAAAASPRAQSLRSTRSRRGRRRAREPFACLRAARLKHDHADRVRDDVVELAGDPRALLGHGGPRAPRRARRSARARARGGRWIATAGEPETAEDREEEDRVAEEIGDRSLVGVRDRSGE